jgi:uncharacterized protein YggE
MAKIEEEESTARFPMRRGGMFVVPAALLIMVGIIGGAYLLSQANFAPTVNVNGGPAYPNVYVSSIPPDHALTVSATSTMDVAPDLLAMQISVKTQDPTAKKSQSDNAAVVADLISKLKAQGLKDEDIQTTSYSVDPIYVSNYVCDKSSGNCHYDNNLTGYTTTQTFALKIYDLTKGGDIIDAASSAGTNQTFVDYISFTLKDETRRALEKSLLANASAEAKSKAGEMARGVSATLGRTLSLSESYSYYPPVYSNLRMAAGAEAAPSAPSTSLSSGQIEVSTTVSASFEIQ